MADLSERRSPSNPSAVYAALRIFDLSLGEMLWSRRTIFMGLVVGLPVLVSAAIRLLAVLGAPMGSQMTGPLIFGLMMWVFFIRFSVPVLAIFYGTALIADEVEDKTLTYLFTRPIRRGAVLMGKYCSYLICTGVVVLPSVMLVYFLIVPLGGGSIGRAFPALVTDLALLAVGLASYGALFAFVGTWLRRPLVAGLAFAFGWEQLTLVVPGYLRRGTVAYYLQALVPHAMPEDSTFTALQGLFRDVPSVAVSLTCLAAITGACLWLAIRMVERREYVLSD